MTTHRYFFLLLIIAIVSCKPNTDKNELPPPNILWITSEDNSPFLGAYGDDYATTPVLDSLASVGVLYENAFASAPVCAPARSTIITGMYANSLGTHHMRSQYAIPDKVKFFPKYLRQAGYYCTNNSKEDYNTTDQPETWDESSQEATYQNREPGQPFFHIRNFTTSHESSIHDSIPMNELNHDPEKAPIPPYHPKTEAMKHDWAQYYDKVQQMDSQVGEVLKELQVQGLADSTIIFYYSDHGGILGRSKRFMFESGLRVPMIVHFPEMYKHLAPVEQGNSTDRLVSFVDLAPTVLSLAGIDIPEYMQGHAFLGEQATDQPSYVNNFRGRMDERIDMVRSVSNKRFRYINNYMPHKIYGQYIEYLWRAPSMRSWHEAYIAGELNEIQTKFWQPKPSEELYDIQNDPDNVHNLASDPEYSDILNELRQAEQNWVKAIHDVGFIPEPMMWRINQDTTLYDFVRNPEFPFEKIVHTANIASSRDQKHLNELVSLFDDDNPVIRYWAVMGCVILDDAASPAINNLLTMTEDPEACVRVAVAEALYKLGKRTPSLQILKETIHHENLMVRVQVINLLENMEDDALPVLDKVKALVEADPDSYAYDIRAGKRLVEQFDQ